MRIGFGYDAHRLKPGRGMILCGVKIPCEFGPDGHSDADAALHALADAILGALALGDIGRHFPDTDPRWLGADSREILRAVYKMALETGYKLENADITIILQAPKLAPYCSAMRQSVASALDTSVENVSVKATTEEHMGFTGSGEGIKACAVVLLKYAQ